MNRKIIMRTIAACVGVFLIIVSLAAFFVVNSGMFEIKEDEIPVVFSRTDVNRGERITADMLEIVPLKRSSINAHMLDSVDAAAGRIALSDIKKGDIVRKYSISEGNYPDDYRITVVAAEFADRLANLVKRGSFVDIRFFKEGKFYTILSKIRVEDMLDESGSVGSAIELSEAGKKLYLKFVLPQRDIDRIYIANALGKCSFELYLDESQQKSEETPLDELVALLMPKQEGASVEQSGNEGE